MTIYLFVNGSGGHHDYPGCAIAEDGHCLAQHWSSSLWYAKHDMGLTSDWKHDRYAAHCPDGYDLEWVDDPLTHAGLQAAYALNQELAQKVKQTGKQVPE